MMTGPAKELIRERLLKDHIAVDEDWLSECVEYFVDDEPAISPVALYEKTLEQWRLSDLSDIGIACLPDTIAEKELPVQLSGNYVVQMLSIIDVSESAYDQLRRLYNKQIDLTDGEKQEFKANAPKKKRSLKLELSDGHRNCVGLEYRPIACLHTKLAPGCKLRLIGPLRCVNGVLLLEPQNVRLLGGEVSKYEVNNAFENMLLRQLGRPLNPAPKSDYEEQRVSEEARDAHNLAALREQHRQSQLNRTQAAILVTPATAILNGSHDIFDDDDQMLAGVNLDDLVDSEQDDDDLQILSAVENADQKLQTAVVDHIELPDDDDDDDDFMEIIASLPDDIKAATSTSQTSTTSQQHESRADAPYYHEDSDENAAYEEQMQFEEDNIVMDIFEPIVKSPAAILTTTSTHLDNNYPHRIQGCNLLNIAQLQRHYDTIKRAQCTSTLCRHPPFIVAAVVDSVFEKLQVKPTGWRIGVLIRDASAILTSSPASPASATTPAASDGAPMLRLRLGDSVLSGLTGTTAEELHQMRKQATDRPQLVETISEILAKLKETLQTLRCFFKLPIAADGDEQSDGVITITDLVNSAPVLERILSNKLTAETDMGK